MQSDLNHLQAREIHGCYAVFLIFLSFVGLIIVLSLVLATFQVFCLLAYSHLNSPFSRTIFKRSKH